MYRNSNGIMARANAYLLMLLFATIDGWQERWEDMDGLSAYCTGNCGAR